jgi:ssRNA-specific RNase YbeY (16S rRNA maturation enzyme)
MINIISSSRYKVNRKLIREKAVDLLKKIGYQENQTVNIVFIGRNKMRQICHRYKKEDTALPVLSFFYDENRREKNNLYAEIILCYPQVVLLAAQRNKKVDDTILKLVEHGVNNLINN